MAYQPATAAETAVSEAQFAVESAENDVYRANIARPVSLQLRRDAETKLNDAKLRLELAEGNLYRESISKPTAADIAVVAPAPAEYRVYFHPMNDQVTTYGWTNCIEDAFVRASTDEEAVALAGPMSRLVSVQRLADVDADFGQMGELQVRAAKQVIREQMSRGEVIRTSFDYLVATIDGQDAVEFIKKNVPQSADGVYRYGGQQFKIWWASVTTGYAGSRTWEIVRTFGSQADDVTPEVRREGTRFECQESMSKTKGAAFVAIDLSTLHGVAYTPEEQAVEGDIVRGPVTLYKVASFNWNPKAAPGTLDAWRTVREMLDYYDRRKTAPNGYLFRITVAEFEVGFLSGDMKGMCCFWNRHVTDVRKDPYSASLLADLCEQP